MDERIEEYLKDSDAHYLPYILLSLLIPVDKAKIGMENELGWRCFCSGCAIKEDEGVLEIYFYGPYDCEDLFKYPLKIAAAGLPVLRYLVTTSMMKSTTKNTNKKDAE